MPFRMRAKSLVYNECGKGGVGHNPQESPKLAPCGKKSDFASFGTNAAGPHFLNRSPMACFMTEPPTSEMERVSGISLGQTSTQF